MKKTLITTIGAAAGVAAGGYYVGCHLDSSSPPSSAFMSKSVLLPSLLGLSGFLLLKRKNKSLAKGLLIGGFLGSAYGYYKCSAHPQVQAAGTAAYLGSNAGVRRALNSNTGSGLGRSLGSVLPKRLQTGGSAYPQDAWARS